MAERVASGWRRVLLWAISAFAALLLAIVAAWEAGALNGVALWGAGQALGYEISCGTIEGGLLSRFTCTDLVLADTKGRFLTAQRLTLAWNPWAFAHNEVAIHELYLTDAKLTRLPQSQSPSAGAGFLPGTRIAIGQMQLERVSLALSGGPRACLGLHGHGAIGPDGFDAALMALRCAPKNGQLGFTGRYDKPSGALSLKASGRDNGAVAAALTGIEAAGPTRVLLNGTGTVSAFNGTVSLQAQHVGAIAADFRARDLTATSLDARFDIVRALLPSWAPNAAGTLSADVTRGPNGGFDISGFDLAWGSLRGSGQVALAADGQLDGRIRLSSVAPLALAGGTAGGLDARVEASGTKDRPALKGAMTVADLSSGSIALGALQANIAATMQSGGAFSASIVGSARKKSLPAPVGGLLGASFGFNADASRATDGAMTLNATVNGAAARLTADAIMSSGSGHGKLTLVVPDLAKANAGFSGRAMAVLDLRSLTLAGDLDGTLRVEGKEISGTGAGAALGTSPSLTAQLRGQGGAYRAGGIRLETVAATATGSASLAANGELSADLRTVRGELAPLSNLLGHKLKGNFDLTAQVSGTRARPAVKLAASAPRIRVDNVIAKDSRLQLDASKAAGWTGRLALASSTPAGKVDLLADMAASDGGWRADIARGALGPATLSGQLSAKGERYSGALALKGDLLSPVGFALGAPMQGSGTLTLAGDGQDLRLAADLKHVAAGPLKDATAAARATAQGLSGQVRASFSVKDGANRLAADAHGTLSPLAITLAKLGGRWAGADFALRAPTTFTSESGKFALDRTTVSIAGGTLALEARGGGGNLDASVHLADMPVAPLASMMRLGKGKGTIALDLTAKLAPQSTQADLHLRAHDLMFAGAGKKQKPADIDLAAHWDGQTARLDGRILGLDSKEATLAAELPVVRPAASYMPRLAQSGPVSARLRAQLQAARLMALLPVAEQSATGLLTGSVDVSGDIANPQLSGKVALADGSFTDYQTGTRLEKLNAGIDATGGSRAVVTLSATDGNSGTVKANGEFSLASLESGSAGQIAGHLDVTLQDAEILREDLAHGSATGTVSIDLPGDQPPAITGKLRTNTVRVDVGAAIPPAVPQIDVIEINGGPGTVLKPQPGTPSLFSKTALDIAITMPNRVYVTGHGIDSEWSGNLDVGGTLATPEVSGKLTVVRGQAEIIGKRFELQDGTVRLDNSIPGNASVHIVGQNESSDITVTVTIDGPVTNPKVTWSSSPALPQSEILSRLFFGTSTPHLTIGQAFQLAQLSGQLGALGQFGGGGGGILGFARNLTGLDVLRVETPSDLKGTGASVTAGKYVSDKVYVGVKQGTDVSAGTAQVEVKITPHITLDAEAGANSQGSAGVTWKWDY